METRTLQQALAQVRTEVSTEPTSGRKQQPPSVELRQRFVRCANDYLLKCEGKPFEIYDKELIEGLFLYFIGSSDSPYDLRKGMWFDGTVGSGKTTLMRVFREFRVSLQKAFRMETAAEIASQYSATGQLDLYIRNADGYLEKPIALCIDELGREQLPAIHYGNKLNVMQHILQQRYGLWQSQGVITHVTTNLSPKEVIDKYEDFIFDRCRHMFNIVSFTGKSKRA